MFLMIGYTLNTLSQWSAASGLRDNNIFTINHVNFNLQIIEMFICWSWVLLIGVLTQNNCNIRIGIKWGDMVLGGLLLLVRVAVLLFFVKNFVLKISLYHWTFGITYDNWWYFNGEPTSISRSYMSQWQFSQSIFNSLLCWTFWLIINAVCLTFTVIIMLYMICSCVFPMLNTYVKSGADFIFYYTLIGLRKFILG